MPGLALLELARGDGTRRRGKHPAGARTRRGDPLQRPALLAAAVDILCCHRRRVGGPHRPPTSWRTLADAASSAVLDAMAAQPTGTVLAERGRPADGAATAAGRGGGVAGAAHALRSGTARRSSSGWPAQRSATARLRRWSSTTRRATFNELGAGPDLERLRRVVRRCGHARRRRSDGEAVRRCRPASARCSRHAGRRPRPTGRSPPTLLISQHTVAPAPGEHLRQAGRQRAVPRPRHTPTNTICV